jgi:quercetin dioxygenase-like cupin family protein
MKTHSIQEFSNGWIIGDFFPSLQKTKDFEVGLKIFKSLDKEPNHFQRIATEATLVVSGHIRMWDHFLKAGEILVVEPGEACDFEALEDSTVLAIKWPSLPDDKVIVD